MRKVVLVAVATLLVSSVQAQFKPTTGSFGMEIQFRPLGQNVFQATEFEFEFENGTTLNSFGISPWFFVSEKLELRADLLFGMASQKERDKDPAGSNDQIAKMSVNMFGLNLGAYYHFNGTERISPYVGANVGFGMANITGKIRNFGYVSGDYTKRSLSVFDLQFAVSTGFNWYIVNGLYLGADIGLGFGFGKPLKEKTITEIGGNKTTDEVKPTTSAWSLNFIANPAIRLGWKF